ncbi:MAG: XdhC family protein [Rhodospirillaceae bacterium]|nr:XdhC family protein [Rhodospirillaceae bacterium]
MSAHELLRAFERSRLSGEPMVLATVYDTEGSTYSKPGHRILVASNGDYQGLVSGGCLEGDLAERARSVLEANAPAAVTYDMRDEADDLWGLGVGCNGMIRVFLQPLTVQNGYEPFAAIAGCLAASESVVVATVIDGHGGDLPAGATLLWDGGEVDSRSLQRLVPGCRAAQARGAAAFERTAGLAVLYAPLQPLRRLLVLGAGLDAVPVVNMAAHLGWRVTIADHRPAYLEKGVFASAEQALLIDAAEMSRRLDPNAFDAVIVMSHHLLTDQTYLAQLADARVGYLGVLGPRARRDRLLRALGPAGDALRDRLHGPVGLDIGADAPASIALSLLAEIHATLAGRSGEALTRKG